MSFRTGIVLNWNSQDLKNDQQPSDIVPDQLLFGFAQENGSSQGIFKNNRLEKAKVILFFGNCKA